jgi:hypothetical protein
LFDDLARVALATTRPRGDPVLNRGAVTETYQPLAAQYVGWQQTLSEAFNSLIHDKHEAQSGRC